MTNKTMQWPEAHLYILGGGTVAPKHAEAGVFIKMDDEGDIVDQNGKTYKDGPYVRYGFLKYDC